MSRSAGLLLILGLALGLWMGFNPQAHQAVDRFLDSGKTFVSEIGTQLVGMGRNLMAGFKSVSERLSRLPVKSNHNSLWPTLSSDFRELWKSLQKIWQDITAGFHF